VARHVIARSPSILGRGWPPICGVCLGAVRREDMDPKTEKVLRDFYSGPVGHSEDQGESMDVSGRADRGG